MVGRKNEIEELERAFESDESEFVAVYGRRRVGKTFLVRETFNDRFTFYHSGVARYPLQKQLSRFRQSLKEFGAESVPALRNWDQAFDTLKEVVKISTTTRKVIFIDEMPWLDTPRSGFVNALEAFWNGWASARKDILLIVCGSAASWIVKNLFRNHGGLHNRVSSRIHLQPLNLGECEQFVREKGLVMSKRDIVEAYMIFGGIPYYWKYLDRRFSLPQNIDRIFFAAGAPLRYEFEDLYGSLFGKSKLYMDVVRSLSSKKAGMTRLELCTAMGVSGSGKLSDALKVLEQCGFIRMYCPPRSRKKNSVYQLIDSFTLFHFRFLNEAGNVDEHEWSSQENSPSRNAWRGVAFERVCLMHLNQIRQKLGISGVHINAYAWSCVADEECPFGAQVDLIIDRADGIVDLCEMKYCRGEFVIGKAYMSELDRKRTAYSLKVSDRKAIHICMVTTEGVFKNEFAGQIQSEVQLEDLFY